MGKMIETIREGVSGFIEENFSKIFEINRKYATPRIKITPLVSFSLLMLRLYLLFLVALLFYKFITLVKT
ncbi:Uncharacterised protein [uncultured archaeon]|nr:Uncharacterised protein [uncultured archaeon]